MLVPLHLHHFTLLFVCRFLDLSFNHITDLENLDGLVKLKKFFIIQNSISVIKNLQPLTSLTTLELGSNKIRVNIIMVNNCASLMHMLLLGN